jgi:predicted transcriptional regulator
MSTEREPFVFSIRPEYVTKILDGTKVWEFRTRRPSLRDDEMILIYETAPCSMIVGTARVPNIEMGEVGFMWRHLLNKGVDRKDYDSYFKGRAFAVAIHLTDVKRISPRPLPDGMRPPQSWSRYKGVWS